MRSRIATLLIFLCTRTEDRNKPKYWDRLRKQCSPRPDAVEHGLIRVSTVCQSSSNILNTSVSSRTRRIRSYGIPILS